MNASAEAVAAAIVESVANDIADKAVGQNTDCIAWLMGDEQKQVRKQIATNIKICITAAKNLQNSYLQPSGLMDKAESADSTVEFT